MPRFGLFTPQVRQDFEQLLERARLAERLGYDSIWLMDHLAAPALRTADCLEAWTVATALLARTETLRVGHLVLCNAFRHPAVLAKMVASLDRISGGRLELGIGSGSVERELIEFGFGGENATQRSERLGEALEVITRLLGGEEVSYQGKYYQLKGAIARPPPIQSPLPIHVGGAGKKFTLPWASQLGSWWNCPSYGVKDLEELIPLARPAKISVQHPVALIRREEDREKVTALAEKRFGAWVGLLIGNADELSEQFRREADWGVEMFIIQFHDFGTPESLQAFAEGVLPNFR